MHALRGMVVVFGCPRSRHADSFVERSCALSLLGRDAYSVLHVVMPTDTYFNPPVNAAVENHESFYSHCRCLLTSST